MRLVAPKDGPLWLMPLLRKIERTFNEPRDRPFQVQAFTVATLPTAADWLGGLVYVSDEAGGAVIAFSDSTNWRRVTDRAIVT